MLIMHSDSMSYLSSSHILAERHWEAHMVSALSACHVLFGLLAESKNLGMGQGDRLILPTKVYCSQNQTSFEVLLCGVPPFVGATPPNLKPVVSVDVSITSFTNLLERSKDVVCLLHDSVAMLP